VRFTAYARTGNVWGIPSSGFGRALDDFRENIYLNMERDLGRQGAALGGALLLGWTGDVDSEMRDSYNMLGISHILSVSGLHVSLLMMVVAWLGRRLGWRRTAVRALNALLIGLYFLLAGARPAFNRVLMMALLGVGAEIFCRESDEVNNLCLAFVLQMAIAPLIIFTSGCQLTCAGFLGRVYNGASLDFGDP
jgi:competence protein ComEC